MLVIRPEQMDAFRHDALRSFVDEMVVHLFRFAPEHCQAIGTDQVGTVVRLGVSRASGYGLTHRGPVRFYLELMFMLGSAFDTDPQLPWARAALNDPRLTGQMDRADLLYERAMDYRDRVIGPGGAHALLALRRLDAAAREPGTFAAAGLPDRMLALFRRVHPEKCACVGDEPLRRLVSEGIERAKAHRFSGERATALFVVLMFMLGHGFADDPLFPWIAHTLNDPRLVSARACAARLEVRMRAYLTRVLDGAEVG